MLFTVDFFLSVKASNSDSCVMSVGDPYFVEYLEPHTPYQMVIRAKSEVGDGMPLTYVVTTPDVCKCDWYY